MNNFKKMIALVISVVMLISVSACAKVENAERNDTTDKENTQQIATENITNVEESESVEKTETESSLETETVANEIISPEVKPFLGTWKASVDLTAFTADMIESSLGSTNAKEYFHFEDVYMYLSMEFKENGTLVITADSNEMVDTLVRGIEDGFRAFAAAGGIDLEDIYAQLDTDEEHFAEDFVEKAGIVYVGARTQHKYKIDGDNIVVDGASVAYEFDGDAVLLMRSVDFALETLVETEKIEFVKQ